MFKIGDKVKFSHPGIFHYLRGDYTHQYASSIFNIVGNENGVYAIKEIPKNGNFPLFLEHVAAVYLVSLEKPKKARNLPSWF